MKKTVLTVFMFLLFVGFAFADQYVKGHWKDTNGDGVKDTYVNSYYRTERDDNPDNNYSTQGNVNPYNGKRGYVKSNNNAESSSDQNTYEYENSSR